MQFSRRFTIVCSILFLCSYLAYGQKGSSSAPVAMTPTLTPAPAPALEHETTMNPIPSWMIKFWDAWDVRLMVLFSLTAQVFLFVLGQRRKFTVKIWIRIILWLLYLIADWIATAILGKLSRIQPETKNPNVLRVLWAPMLLLHLGGPDTITAYVLEDNMLWKRHLLGLLVETSLVIYIFFLSLNSSWVSLVMNGLMFIAGIIKYSERTWSLMLASSRQAERTIPVFDMDTLVENTDEISDGEKLVIAYQLFSAFRPDITNYISPRENLSSSGTKLIMRFMHNVEMTGLGNINMDYLLQTLEKLKPDDLSETTDIQMGFLFDVLYTKVPVTYTKLGCIFRIISVSCTLCVTILFFTLFRNEWRKHYSSVDIVVTCILLVGAIIIEFYAVKKLVHSNWTMLWIGSRNCKTRFVYRILGSFVSSLLTWEKHMCRKGTEKKRIWSNLMGQFNLVSYCFNNKKEVRLDDFRKMIHRDLHTKFKKVPSSLKGNFSDPFSGSTESSFIATRGEAAIKKYSLADDIKRSTELDFDESIITWHLVTDICYHESRYSEENNDALEEGNERVNSPSTEKKLKDTCQVISNYMMYLLVMQPDMILPGYRKDFWFSHVSETLGSFYEQQRKAKKDNYRNPYASLRIRMESRGATELEGNVRKIVDELEKETNKWEIINALWLEMLSYAAIACQHVNHARQLRRGGEYITHLWLRLTMSFLKHT